MLKEKFTSLSVTMKVTIIIASLFLLIYILIVMIYIPSIKFRDDQRVNFLNKQKVLSLVKSIDSYKEDNRVIIKLSTSEIRDIARKLASEKKLKLAIINNISDELLLLRFDGANAERFFSFVKQMEKSGIFINNSVIKNKQGLLDVQITYKSSK